MIYLIKCWNPVVHSLASHTQRPMYFTVWIQCMAPCIHANMDVLPTPTSQSLFSHELVFIPYPGEAGYSLSLGASRGRTRLCHPLPVDPASFQTTEGGGFLKCGKEFGYWSAKEKNKLSNKEIINRRWVKDTAFLSFLPKRNLFPSHFLHPMFGDGFGTKNEPQYHNYSSIPTNGSSLMNDLFF